MQPYKASTSGDNGRRLRAGAATTGRNSPATSTDKSVPVRRAYSWACWAKSSSKVRVSVDISNKIEAAS